MPVDPQTDPVLDRARAYFEEFAGDYDGAAAEAGWMPNDLLAEALETVRGVRTAVDLACGTGSSLAVVRRAFPEADLVGVDLSASMIDRARTRVPGTRLVQADAADYAEMTEERFDLVTAVGGFEFTPDLPDLLERVRRLVRPGGDLVFTYEPEITGWEPQAARAETNLGSNGLDLTTLRWEPGEVAAGFEGWRQVRDRLVVAYRRDGLPTVYGWLHYRRVG